VARHLLETLKGLNMKYPEVTAEPKEGL
jgi:hypothetical protein